MSREDVDKVADYQASYWECARVRDEIQTGKIKIPYARRETVQLVLDVLMRISNKAWGVDPK